MSRECRPKRAELCQRCSPQRIYGRTSPQRHASPSQPGRPGTRSCRSGRRPAVEPTHSQTQITLGRSSSPPVPSAAYRFFHKITVGSDAPVRRTISLVPSPSPASSTIRARWASPARIDVDRTHEASTSRSRGGTSTHTVKAINPASAKHRQQSRNLTHGTLGSEPSARSRLTGSILVDSARMLICRRPGQVQAADRGQTGPSRLASQRSRGDESSISSKVPVPCTQNGHIGPKA